MYGISLTEIYAARRRTAGRVRRTPLEPSTSLTTRSGAEVLLKREQHQTTGSFKLRGATNAILMLTPEERARGVVCASTGNHGRALAFAAAAEKIRCVVCMSSLVPSNKVAGIRALGAEIRIVGQSQDDAQVAVDRLVRDESMTAVPPFDDPAIIAGQGTVGLEIMEDAPQTRLVLVPLSGGGLAAGVALAVKAIQPSARVIGVSMARGSAMAASLDAGRPMPIEELPTLADSLGGGIGLDNRYTFAIVRDLLDDVVLLDEAEIGAAIVHAYRDEQDVVEGAGAVGIGALIAGKVRVDGPAVIVISGRNIDMELHRRIISGNPPVPDHPT
jgi:threonine dehydratase